MPTSMARRRAELLDDVAAQTATVLADFNLKVDDEMRDQIGHALADHLADHWGGQVLSFPKDSSYRCAARDRAILADNQRMTISALAQKYSMTERGIRKILKRAQIRDSALNQGKLFED
jgi:Mor family transcriptional regulator